MVTILDNVNGFFNTYIRMEPNVTTIQTCVHPLFSWLNFIYLIPFTLPFIIPALYIFGVFEGQNTKRFLYTCTSTILWVITFIAQHFIFRIPREYILCAVTTYGTPDSSLVYIYSFFIVLFAINYKESRLKTKIGLVLICIFVCLLWFFTWQIDVIQLFIIAISTPICTLILLYCFYQFYRYIYKKSKIIKKEKTLLQNVMVETSFIK